jgi:Restriction endonuclease
MSQLDEALRKFEAVEANLVKLERMWKVLCQNTPSGIVFGANPVYEDACRSYEQVVVGLPLIDAWKPTTLPYDLDEIAQSRLDAHEVGEIGIQVEVDRRIEAPGKELREYRFRFNQKRRKLIQSIVAQTINEVDQLLSKLQASYPLDGKGFEVIEGESQTTSLKDQDWQVLSDKVQQIDVLLGSSVPRPPRWGDMKRHLHYGELWDLRDIVNSDWPSVKEGLLSPIYSKDEPIPVGIDDLSELVASKPSGTVLTKLSWEKLSPEDFERLMFNLITSDKNYENPQWLMHTNAPDRGRDLSVYRIYRDQLNGVTRERVIIQCKHWLSKSISLQDISTTKEQVKLWEPPRIDNLVIATTGRFTTDAVAYAEKHNQSDSAMAISLWAESHLETILASSPAMIAEFGLR